MMFAAFLYTTSSIPLGLFLVYFIKLDSALKLARLRVNQAWYLHRGAARGRTGNVISRIPTILFHKWR